MHVLQTVVLVLELHAEGARKPIAEVVARAALQRLAVVHQRLDRIGCDRTGKLLLVGLLTAHHRNRELLLAEIRVEIQHLFGSRLCLLFGRVHGVSLLPEELTGAEERTGRLLPAHHRTPLVQHLRQIAIRVHMLRIVIAEQRLRGRAHAEALLQGLKAALRDPGDFRREALDMIFLLVEKTLGNKKRHVAILYACRLEALIQKALDALPDCISGGLNDHTAFDARIVAELCLPHNVGIPLCEILFHRSNLFDRFFLLCHTSLSPLVPFLRGSVLGERAVNALAGLQELTHGCIVIQTVNQKCNVFAHLDAHIVGAA